MKLAIPALALASVLIGPAVVAAAGHMGGGAPRMGMATMMAQHPAQATGVRTNQTPTTMTPNTVRGPTMTGQPKQSCSNFPETPGHSASAPGSAFNPSGNAGTHYAGQQPQNSQNTASVAQYDVACSHQP